MRGAGAIGTTVFFVVMSIATVLSFMLSLRPTVSNAEKRNLMKFPSFTISGFLHGEYTQAIGDWFADTMPFRDTLTKYSDTIKKTLGIHTKISNFSERVVSDAPKAEDGEEINQDTVDVTVAEVTTNVQALLDAPALPDSIEPHQGEGGGHIEQALDSVYLYDNAAFEYYNFVESTADRYVAAVNRAADELDGTGIQVYNMIIPTSMDIKLPQSVRDKLNTSDQNNAINYMTRRLSQKVKPVMIYDLEKKHANEYTYFRTDHHWTTLGAYYAYAQFMAVKGESFTPLSEFTPYAFSPYLGSFYSASGNAESLSATPDTVYAYAPPVPFTFKMKTSMDEDFMDWALIADANDYDTNCKYLCFIGGDQCLSLLENTAMQQGNTLVLVKESFGNCFVPYLACNYKKVYVIDYREFDGDITEYAKQVGANEILFQNNISMTRNEGLVEELEAKV